MVPKQLDQNCCRRSKARNQEQDNRQHTMTDQSSRLNATQDQTMLKEMSNLWLAAHKDELWEMREDSHSILKQTKWAMQYFSQYDDSWSSRYDDCWSSQYNNCWSSWYDDCHCIKQAKCTDASNKQNAPMCQTNKMRRCIKQAMRKNKCLQCSLQHNASFQIVR